MSKNAVPVCELPVMKAHCKTCPFRDIGGGRWADVAQANEVVSRTLFQAQQICHSTEGPEREPRNRCKGAYDHNYEIYERLGMAHLLK